MSGTTNDRDRPAWVDLYLGHRSAYRGTHPQHPGTLMDRDRARLEMVSLAHTIADLTEQAPYGGGAFCARTDPTGQDATYEEAHAEKWSGQAVREALAPVLGALRDVESALDDVDSIQLDPDLIDRLRDVETSPEVEVTLSSLAVDLVDRRTSALDGHGLSRDVLSYYLAYQHLPVRDHMLLYVMPATPWDYAGVALAEALSAYTSASPQRYETAAARIVWHRNQNAPTTEWNW